MTPNNEPFNPFDPTGLFKEMRTTSLDAWSKAMIQAVNSEAYARATAVMLDAWLANSVPFRKALEGAMAQALAAANMPTRTDVINLAERLTHIELRLDDLEARLEESPRGGRRPASHKAKTGTGENHA
jgi:hypothetical protein